MEKLARALSLKGHSDCFDCSSCCYFLFSLFLQRRGGGDSFAVLFCAVVPGGGIGSGIGRQTVS